MFGLSGLTAAVLVCLIVIFLFIACVDDTGLVTLVITRVCWLMFGLFSLLLVWFCVVTWVCELLLCFKVVCLFNVLTCFRLGFDVCGLNYIIFVGLLYC